MAKSYAHPEYLVDTQWVAEHLNDPNVRVVESNEDTLLYETGHIPGAVKVDWFSTLQDPVRRDFLSKEQFEKLCSEAGIANDTTIVFYGDKSNWFATYALWLFRYYGHQNLKIMNGGRAKWQQEGRPLTKERPDYSKTKYQAKEANASVRAYRDDVFGHIASHAPLLPHRGTQFAYLVCADLPAGLS
ncbi:MAG: rhodanese-like domain-containing protein [Anaerolineales bacterium]